MSGSFSISIDAASFADALATMRALNSNLLAVSVSVISDCAEQTKDQIVSETLNVLNVDEERVNSEIAVTHSASGTLQDHRSTIISKGKPIELIDFSEDAEGWNWKNPTPVHARIYRQGARHEFRHVFVAGGHIYERLNHDGAGNDRLSRPWIKYSPKGSHYRLPVKRLISVRVQDIQKKPELIDPVVESGADAVVAGYGISIDEVFANV